MIIRLGAAIAVLLLLPSFSGAAIALTLFFLLPRVLRALPTARTQRREVERSENALLLAEALAAHQRAGVPLLESLESCAATDNGDLGDATRGCAQLIRIGSKDPFAPWQRWAPLEPLARELTRALRTGGVLGAATNRAAQQMRDHAHRQRRMAVERLSVRLTFPVALCLLPAFLLLAVIPPALGILQQLDISSTSSP